MGEIHVAILIGTTREQRKSVYAARLMKEIADTYPEITSELVDPKDFTFEGDGNDPEGKDVRYTEITERADAFLIVTPEYNHSFPGSLKRMLDSELKNYIHKPVAFAGVSSGGWGGVRAIESLVNAVREMGLIATFTDMQFPRVQDLFSEEGKLLDEKYREYPKKLFNELIWMATVLKHGRENVEKIEHK
ncbi:NAD(P)H-dependent oxidoreductase [Candidatus Saccharibacteria bacterium]|nr:NAD(P)H-dependent oxidoreductase [Candidatus Saccharibacteria bacterium]